MKSLSMPAEQLPDTQLDPFGTLELSALETSQSFSLDRHNPSLYPHMGHGGSTKGRATYRKNRLVINVTGACEYSEPSSLEIGNTKEVTAYYKSAFRQLQTSDCRSLAEIFVESFATYEQANRPCNSGKEAVMFQGEESQKSRPEWWPQDIKHEGPDDIMKESLIELLVHLLQNLLPIGTTAAMFEKASDGAKNQASPAEQARRRTLILDEIFRVRKTEERYKKNEIDGTTQVFVSNGDKA
ncbi:conserved hypothetical protein [Talaromyces stipitatus ATCC 10500]|uniref:Subtelomeric hrmA-associated cluster protein AFUB-079030/YDR124W-like helical bundle domain-containing protein n=1 Tax=Talaromyces stipitatus (strain ATCC 10500 / CBS 375.48 / QM 6759 / NRRL 1006) TaxID=441959 RepID=B8MUP8_TALSN|nr:uncharacterized protein TSTA_108970 [Talaromyces stipitatus ATCC 10500]EED11716.1 conserved hypothetical protein [Talaromyces stipitatus ATCC 10500]